MAGSLGAIAASTALTGVASAKVGFRLVDCSVCDSAIVIDDNADSQTVHAAQILAEYMQKATGAVLPVVMSSTVVSGPGPQNRLIYVGTAVADPPILPAELDAVGEDGYVIKVAEYSISIGGGSSWGTRFGVYEFLERYLGVRWLMPGESGEDVPQSSTIVVPIGTVAEKPAFQSRTLYPFPVVANRPWDEVSTIAWRAQQDLTWGRFSRMHWSLEFQHNLFAVIPPATFGVSNPEFFTLINGQVPGANVRTGWQPVFGAPGIAAAGAIVVLNYLHAHPQTSSYSLSVNDGGVFSPADVNVAQPNSLGFPHASEAYFQFVNDVVDLVSVEFPDVLFGALAYTGTSDPPSFPLHPNVVPVLAHERYGWVDADYRDDDMSWTDSWRAVAQQIGVWEYSYGSPYCLPRLYLHEMAEACRFLATRGTVAQLAELRPNWGEGPKPWVFSKILWNPNVDVSALESEWYERAVGAAAATPLSEYFQHWTTFWSDRVPGTAWFSAARQFYPYSAVDYLELVTETDMQLSRNLLEETVTLADTTERITRANLLLQAFEYYEASALSYPRPVAAVGTSTTALELLNDSAASLDERVVLAQRRLQIVNEVVNHDVLAHYLPPAPQGMVWSGWNLYDLWNLADYVSQNEPVSGPVRSRAVELKETSTSLRVRDYAAALLSVADGDILTRGSNLSFDDPDLSSWTIFSGYPTAEPHSRVVNISHSSGASLRIPAGFSGRIAQQVPVTPGPLRFSVFFLAPADNVPGGYYLKLWCRLLDHNGTRVQQFSRLTSLNSTPGQWQQFTVSDMITAGSAVTAECWIVVDTTAPIYLDDVSIVQLPVRVQATPPDLVAGLPPADWFDFQDSTFRLYSGNTELLEDSLASDHVAVQMPGNTPNWGVQLPLSVLPAGRTWKLYASVRADTGSAGATATALRLGISPALAPYAGQINVPVSDVNDGDYHEIAFPGVYERDVSGRYAYVAPPNSPSIPAVFVDRIFAIAQ